MQAAIFLIEQPFTCSKIHFKTSRVVAHSVQEEHGARPMKIYKKYCCDYCNRRQTRPSDLVSIFMFHMQCIQHTTKTKQHCENKIKLPVKNLPRYDPFIFVYTLLLLYLFWTIMFWILIWHLTASKFDAFHVALIWIDLFGYALITKYGNHFVLINIWFI